MEADMESLREKIDDGHDQKLIATVGAVGYMLDGTYRPVARA